MANGPANKSEAKNDNKTVPAKVETVLSKQDVADVQKAPEITAPPTSPDLIIGDTVQYIIPRGPSKGEKRPALVTRLVDAEKGIVDLYVFFSPVYDGELYSNSPAYVMNVETSEELTRGSYVIIE